MKILITGGFGFIGSHLSERMLKKGHEVVIFDNLSNPCDWKKPKEIKLIKGDVRDIKAIDKATRGVDYVFHLAAITSIPESIKKPKETMEVNDYGTYNVLQACLKNNAKLLFASSCAVYNINNPYAESKDMAERFINLYSNISSVSLRYFNIYGERSRGVISIFLKRARENKPLIIYGTGKQTRDFIHIDDVIRATMMRKTGTFDIGTGVETSINKLAKMIIKITNSSSKIVYQKARKNDIMRSRAKGFKAKISLEQGLCGKNT
jgi:UDP-glucose 4-epimerase